LTDAHHIVTVFFEYVINLLKQTMETSHSDCLNYITTEDVKVIISKCGYDCNDVSIDSFTTTNASNNLLGFLCDYWKLKVHISIDGEEKPVLSFFIKAASKINEAKAKMVRELKLFRKEIFLYSVLKEKMEVGKLNCIHCFR
jgi:hypothetical protein